MCQNRPEKKDINGDITIGNIETKKPAQSQGVLMAKNKVSFDQVFRFWLGLNGTKPKQKGRKNLFFFFFGYFAIIPKCAVFSKIQPCTLCTQLLRLHFPHATLSHMILEAL